MRSSTTILFAVLAALVVASSVVDVSARRINKHHRNSAAASSSGAPGSSTGPSAGSATLVYQTFPATTCNTGTYNFTSQSYQTGVCLGNVYEGTTQYFCDQEYAYTVQYASANNGLGCVAENIQSVQRNPLNQCQTGVAGVNSPLGVTSSYSCLNSATSPPLPFSYPPQQSIVTSTCTDSTGEVVCGTTSDDAVCTEIAVTTNVCLPQFGPIPTSIANSTQVFVTPDGLYQGIAYYSSVLCSVMTGIDLLALSCESQTVNSGSYVTSGVQALPFPTPSPSVGFSQSYDNNCDPTTAIISSYNYQTPDVCFRSTIQTCSESGLVVEYWNPEDTTCLGESIGSYAAPLGCNGGTTPVCQYYS